MKKGIVVKVLSAGLCVAVSVSMAACAKTEETRETTEEETIETEIKKSIESSEETSSEETTETTEQTTEEDKINPYEEFIQGYKEAIANPTDTWYYGPGVDTSDYMNLGQGLIVVEIQNGFSYTLFDIDKDGVDELIIGGVYTNSNNVKFVYVTGVVALERGGSTILKN